ncbi:MAG: M48 family metalloprotease [Balneolaceae bacterium]
MKKVFVLWPLFVALVLATSSCVVQQNPVSGNKRAFAYSWDQEVEIGTEVDKEISAQYGLYEDAELESYVTNLGEVLLEESHMRREDTPEQFKNTEFTFRVLNSPVVNAFALPGGYVYVTRGLLAHLNNEAQLAVVLGHEIGHVAGRHASQRALSQTIGQVAVIGGSILGQELLGLPGESLMNLSGQAAQLLFLSYSREHERESDALGVEYSAMSGYDAAEGAAFFTSLKRISEKAGQTIPSLLSSHPDPGERESNIPKMANEWKDRGYDQTIKDREEYFERIDGIIYGENPREGFVNNGVFVHPDLEFQFPVPSGWQVINQPSQVVAVSPEEDAVIIFRIDGNSTTAKASVDEFTSQEGMIINEQGNTQSSGEWPAYYADVTVEDEQQNIGLLVYAVEMDGRVFRFINYTSEEKYDTIRPQFENTSSSFDELTDPELLQINPVRLQTETVNRTDQFRNFLPSNLPMDIDPEEIAIVNQVSLDDEIQSGTKIKIPRQ